MTSQSVTPPGEERKGERTRAAVLAAAARRFRWNGFDATTLSDIADDLSITRSAVLHHFSSKANLLEEIVRPFMEKLDEVLDAAAAAGPFNLASRRKLVVDLVDFMSAHRDVTALLTRDITVHAHLPPELQLRDRMLRFMRITQDANDAHPQATTRALAAIGAVARPIAAEDDVVDLTDPVTRALLVQVVMAVLKTPLPDQPR